MNEPFADPQQEPQLPPLRVHHFMLWTVVSAVLFTALKSVSAGAANTSLMQGGYIPYFLAYSIAISGIGLGVVWNRRGIRFYHQPGHTAFILHGINALSMLLWSLIWWSSPDFNTSDSIWITWVLQYGWTGIQLFQIALCLYFAYRFRHPLRWRLVFIFQAMMFGFYVFSSFAVNWLIRLFSTNSNPSTWFIYYQLFYAVLAVLLMFHLIFVMHRDYRQKVAYHWTHWIGTATWLLTWLTMIGQCVWTFFFPPDWG